MRWASTICCGYGEQRTHARCSMTRPAADRTLDSFTAQ
jgi:hypothetical protein